MSVAPAILAVCFLVFIVVWISLTFTNQFCTGKIGFGLCYKTSDDPACPVCPTTPAPVTTTTTSSYMRQPYSM